MYHFSIIFPTYGVEEYLAESIGDVLAQSYDRWELIIVDDCSPDRSGEIADQFAAGDPRIRVIHRPRNRGVGEARNLGLKHATGDYILFLDPDDRFSHRLLERVAQELEKNNDPQVILYSLREDYYDDGGTIVYSRKHTHPTVTLRGKDEIYPAIIDLERETMYGYPWNKAFSRRLLTEAGVRFKRIVHVEDILFNIDVFDHVESLVILSDVLYFYRNRVASRDQRLTEKYMADYFRVQKIRVRRLLRQYQKRRRALSPGQRQGALSAFAAEYYRSYLSVIEREISHGTPLGQVWEMAAREQHGRLNRFLRPHMIRNASGGRAVRWLYRPLAMGRMVPAFAAVFAIRRIKVLAPAAYDRFKQAR